MAFDPSNLIYVTQKNPYDPALQTPKQEHNAVREAYKKQLDTDRDKQLAATNAQYDNSARANYLRYMQQKKNIPSDLNAAGINGGASESSLIRLGTNYGTAVANNEAGRNSDLDALRQTYINKKAAYDEQMDKELNQMYDTAVQNQMTWEREQLDKDLERFSGAITNQYATPNEYLGLIAELQKSNDPNKEYKIMLARQAMNALARELEEQELAKKSSGGGGYGRSYGGYGGYGSSSSSTAEPAVSSNDAKAVTDALAKAVVNSTTPLASAFRKARVRNSAKAVAQPSIYQYYSPAYK